MKLQAEIEGKKHNVTLEREGRNITASVDGRKYELDVSEPEPGVVLMKHDGKVYEASVSAGQRNSETQNVRLGSNEYDIRMVDPKRLRSAGSDSEHSEGTVEIKTAMPGKIVRILMYAGAVVKKGDAVIVVEAMKMQNELKSPKDGIITEIRHIEGITVNAGDVLAVIE